MVAALDLTWLPFPRVNEVCCPEKVTRLECSSLQFTFVHSMHNHNQTLGLSS